MGSAEAIPGRESEPAGLRLSRAALELFSRKGFHATGIREIGAHAGVSTSMLYHYLSSKDEALYDLVLAGLSRHAQALRAACATVERPEERLAALVGVHIIVPVKHPQMSRLLHLHTHDWPDRPEIGRQRERTNRLWREVLELGCDQNVFTVESASLARVALMRSTTLVTEWYRERGTLDLAGVTGQFIDLALGTVRASRDGRPLRSGDLERPPLDHLIEIVETVHDDVWW